MKLWGLILIPILISGHLFAQEQMVLRLNEKGIMKILQLGLQYNTAAKDSQMVVIPQNIYKFTIPKEKLIANPIVPLLNEISDLNLNHDLDFYFNTSDIKIQGNVDGKSLKTKIFNSHDNGFDIRISLNLPQLLVNGNSLSLCEDRELETSNCGNGLKVSLSNLQIMTLGKPVTLDIVLRLKTDHQVARVSVLSVVTNLEGEGSPDLDINFKSIDIPPITIFVNGQKTELDTSKLKSEIFKFKLFLSRKLMTFAADFIANDMAEMINLYLVNKEVATTFQLYRKDQAMNFNEFLNKRDLYPIDRTNMDPPILDPRMPITPLNAMFVQIADLVRSAQLDIILNKIKTPENKDIELSGLVNFVLNGKHIKVKNTLGNSRASLPQIDLSPYREYDVNLAISETLINGVLDLADSTKLFQQIFKLASPVQGVSIRNVKAHFLGNKSLVAVVNTEVDLKKLKSVGVTQWFKNGIAAWLERNNNNSIIYFPIEVPIVPIFKLLPTGGTGLELKILSPFNYSQLPNRFNYPTNVPNMTDTVKNGVMEELRSSLEPHTNKNYNIDLTKYLNQSGVVFLPKSISINQGAYLLLNLDIVELKFNSKNPNQR